MLAEELLIVDGASLLWRAARPWLDAALRLEQHDESYCWYGWQKRHIETFLRKLPTHCSLVVGVWETVPVEGERAEQDFLTLGVVCEVVEGEVRSISTFEALAVAGLMSTKQLEIGYEDALEVMRAARIQVAPVAWALFTDKATWDKWLFASSEDGGSIDKGELLASLAQQGRCVLLGSQVAHPHHPHISHSR